jgi:hypothetical protein
MTTLARSTECPNQVFRSQIQRRRNASIGVDTILGHARIVHPREACARVSIYIRAEREGDGLGFEILTENSLRAPA